MSRRQRSSTCPIGEIPMLMGSRIDAAFNQAVLASSYIKSGKVRALVLAAARRLPILPDVPSSSEAAMPDLQVNAWTALFAPRETPEAVDRKLNSAVGQTLAEDGVLKRLSALRVDVRLPNNERRSRLRI